MRTLPGPRLTTRGRPSTSATVASRGASADRRPRGRRRPEPGLAPAPSAQAVTRAFGTEQDGVRRGRQPDRVVAHPQGHRRGHRGLAKPLPNDARPGHRSPAPSRPRHLRPRVVAEVGVPESVPRPARRPGARPSEVRRRSRCGGSRPSRRSGFLPAVASRSSTSVASRDSRCLTGSARHRRCIGPRPASDQLARRRRRGRTPRSRRRRRPPPEAPAGAAVDDEVKGVPARSRGPRAGPWRRRSGRGRTSTPPTRVPTGTLLLAARSAARSQAPARRASPGTSRSEPAALTLGTGGRRGQIIEHGRAGHGRMLGDPPARGIRAEWSAGPC